MNRHILLILTFSLLLLPTPLFAQLGGLKQSIGNQLQDAQDQRNEQLNEALGQNRPPTDQAKPPQDTGWIQVLGKDSALTKVRLYVSHPNLSSLSQPPRLPAVLLIPDSWGVNDEVTQRVDDLAGKGYFAAAVDLYDSKVAADMSQANTLRNRLTPGNAQVRMTAAVFYFMDKAKENLVNPERIAVMGWGTGGDYALHLATTDLRIKATALFYAPLITDPEKLKNLKGPVFGAFGNDDHNPTPESVHQFESALAKLQIPNEIHLYEGAPHYFATRAAVPTGEYRDKLAADSTEKVNNWLAKILNNAPATQPKP